MISTETSSPEIAPPARNSIHEFLPRAKRAERTRERIVQAAAQAFSERGYLGVNLNEVVTKLGLTKGALYYFFPTKPALAAEIVRRHFATWQPMAQEILASHDDALDTLVEVMYRVAKMYQTDRVTRAGSRLSTERMFIDAELPEPFVGWVGWLSELISRGQAAHQIRADVDPEAIAQLLVSFFYGAQVVSDHFSQRADLTERLDQFWAVTRPYLSPAPA